LVRTSGDDRAAASPRLRQIGEGSGPHAKALDWFKTLPVWLEVPGLRMVHACWNRQAQEILRPHLDAGHRFTKAGLRAAARKGTKAYDAAEILLKGPEARLPEDGNFNLFNYLQEAKI
jgi:hypothetical protein